METTSAWLKKELRETFLLVIFQCLGEEAPGREVTCLPMKQAGLYIPEPKKTAPKDWTASCVITIHLVTELRGQEEFRTAEHSSCL